jgi:hypothetical protein
VKRGAQLALSLAISGGALWFCLHDLDFGELVAELRGARLVWVVPMAALAVLSLWLRALRWAILLRTLGPLGDTPVFEATCIGFMGNMVLPLRAGEAIRPIVVARGGRFKLPAGLATVAIDRLLDMVMLGVFACLALFVVPTGDTLRTAAHGLAIAVGLGIVVLGLILRAAGWIELFVARVSGRLPVILARILKEAVGGFLRGIRGLSDWRTLAAALFYSALIWIVAALTFVTGALALEIQAPLLPLGIAAAVIVAAAVSVPSAPGFIGVYWAGSEMALALFGVGKATAFTFGILTWAVQLVVIVALGMWSLARLNLSFGEVSVAKTVEPA